MKKLVWDQIANFNFKFYSIEIVPFSDKVERYTYDGQKKH